MNAMGSAYAPPVLALPQPTQPHHDQRRSG
jgi:hypothetical protein